MYPTAYIEPHWATTYGKYGYVIEYNSTNDEYYIADQNNIYVYDGNGKIDRLLDYIPQLEDGQGGSEASLSVSDNYIVRGLSTASRLSNPTGNTEGIATLLDKDCNIISVLKPPTSYTNQRFGYDVEIDESRNIVCVCEIPQRSGGITTTVHFFNLSGTWLNSVSASSPDSSYTRARIKLYDGKLFLAVTELHVWDVSDYSKIVDGAGDFGGGTLYMKINSSNLFVRQYFFNRIDICTHSGGLVGTCGSSNNFALDGNDLLVGSGYEIRQYTAASSWTDFVTLLTNTGLFDSFYEINNDGNKLVASDIFGNTWGDESGEVYFYDKPTFAFLFSKTASEFYTGFGLSLDCNDSSKKLVIGAPYDGDIDTNAGAAWMYRVELYEPWNILSKKLKAPDGSANDEFGSSVAVSETKIVVGAPNINSVYLFNLDGTYDKKITAIDSVPGDNFGFDVEILTDKVYVSAPNANAVYIFDFGGTQLKKITPTISGSLFGSSIAAETKLVIGEIGANKVHRYTLDGIFEDTITESASIDFAKDVAIDNEQLVVSAKDEIYVYDLSSGSGEYSFILNAPLPGQDYGYKVAIDYDNNAGSGRIMTSMPRYPASDGYAYSYKKDGTAFSPLLIDYNIEAGSGTGLSIAIAGVNLYVGRPYRSNFVTDGGVVQFYKIVKSNRIEGWVTEDGSPVQRNVVLYNSTTGEYRAEAISNAFTGYFQFSLGSDETDEFYCVALDSSAGYDLDPIVHDKRIGVRS